MISHVLECPASNPLTRALGRDLERQHRVGCDGVLNPCVEILCILTKYDQIDILVGCLDPWERLDWTIANKEIEFLPQMNICAPIPSSLGRRERPLESQTSPPNSIQRSGMGWP